jgi:ferric iron reductase protein FhuF
MTKLTADQIKQLNMYSIYTDKPERKLFTLADFLGDQTEDALTAAQAISRSPNKTVAASYFIRRFGMFIAMQFYNLAMYDEIWDGELERLTFGAKEEFGNMTVSMFANTEDWRSVEDDERNAIIRDILKNQCDAVIRQTRTAANVSSLTLWESVFGFLLWHYHVLLENPGTVDEARADLHLLKDDVLWEGIAPRSLFAVYLKGLEPSALLNTVVRTTCCLSKDVPGLMQCGFCPLLKN